MSDKPKPRLVIMTPTVKKPFDEYMSSMETAAAVLEAAGIEVMLVFEIGNAYISGARATLLRKALDRRPDAVMFIDHDLSFTPAALKKLVMTKGDIVAGTYRFKEDVERYMGFCHVKDGALQVRQDGALKATYVPAGFMKITRHAVNYFMEKYPELIYGERCLPHIDLFNHGAMSGLWHGEDYAFCKRWGDIDGDIWLVPDLDITHHTTEAAYPGNFWKFIVSKDYKVRSIPQENLDVAA